MLKPTTDGYYCGEGCTYQVDGHCHAYDDFRKWDREEERRIRTPGCIADHGRGEPIDRAFIMGDQLMVTCGNCDNVYPAGKVHRIESVQEPVETEIEVGGHKIKVRGFSKEAEAKILLGGVLR